MPWGSGQGKPQANSVPGQQPGPPAGCGPGAPGQASSLEHLASEEGRRELVLSSLGKGQLWGTQRQPACASGEQREGGLLTAALGERMRDKTHRWKQKGFCLGVLREEVVQAPSLEVSNTQQEKALRNLVWPCSRRCSEPPKVPSIPNYSVILWSTSSNWISGTQCVVCLFAVKTPTFLNES